MQGKSEGGALSDEKKFAGVPTEHQPSVTLPPGWGLVDGKEFKFPCQEETERAEKAEAKLTCSSCGETLDSEHCPASRREEQEAWTAEAKRQAERAESAEAKLAALRPLLLEAAEMIARLLVWYDPDADDWSIQAGLLQWRLRKAAEEETSE